MLARSVSLFAEDIEPDLVSVSQVGCPSDFGRPACRVWFTIAQPGGVALDTLGVEKQAAGEFGSSQPLIERNVFAFELSRGSDSWSARVLLTLHSRDAKGRPYSLRQRARLVVSEATCEC